MKFIVSAILVFILFPGMAAASPSYETLSKLPVVRFGDPVPTTDYILQFPAGQPITISFTIEGSLFVKPARTELTVAPAREIFVYKEWASLDGLIWMPRGELILSDVDVKVPGYNHPQQGALKVRMDLPGNR